MFYFLNVDIDIYFILDNCIFDCNNNNKKYQNEKEFIHLGLLFD